MDRVNRYFIEFHEEASHVMPDFLARHPFLSN